MSGARRPSGGWARALARVSIPISLIGAWTPQAVAAQVLWGKIEVDMPFESARAAYPDGEVFSGKGLFGPMITFDQVADGCSMTSSNAAPQRFSHRSTPAVPASSRTNCS